MVFWRAAVMVFIYTLIRHGGRQKVAEDAVPAGLHCSVLGQWRMWQIRIGSRGWHVWDAALVRSTLWSIWRNAFTRCFNYGVSSCLVLYNHNQYPKKKMSFFNWCELSKNNFSILFSRTSCKALWTSLSLRDATGNRPQGSARHVPPVSSLHAQ